MWGLRTRTNLLAGLWGVKVRKAGNRSVLPLVPQRIAEVELRLRAWITKL